MNFIRPSDVVRSIEDGFIGAAQLLGNVGHAVRLASADKLRAFHIEYSARRMADANALADRITQEERDVDEVNARMRELMAARKAKLRKAA